MANPRFEDTSPLDNTPSFDSTSPLEDEEKKSKLGNLLKYLSPIQTGLDLVTDPLGINRAIQGRDVTPMERGVRQGASLGFSDEIAGGLGAAKGLVTGQDINDSYVNARDESRAADTQAKAEHPYLYGAGELSGGLAVPGLGVGAKAFKATKNLPFITRMLARTGAGAAEGATLGAVGAAGLSEGDSIEDVAKDIGSGAVVPSLVGGVIPGAATIGGELIHQGGKLARKLPFEVAQTSTQAYDKGLQGTILNKDKHLNELGAIARNTNDYLTGQLKKLRTQYDDLIRQFDESGGRIDLGDKANEIEAQALELLQNTKDPDIINDINTVRQKIKNYVRQPETVSTTVRGPDQIVDRTPIDTSGGLMPPEKVMERIPTQQRLQLHIPGETSVNATQSKELQSTLGDLASPERSTLGTTKGRIFAGESKQALNEEFNDIPLLRETNRKYLQLNNALDQLNIKPEELRLDVNGNLNPDVTKKLASIMENAEKNTTGQIAITDQLSNAIQSLKSIDPIQAKALENSVREVSENLALSKKLGNTGWARLVSLPGITGTASNVAGYAVGKYGGQVPGLVERMTATTTNKLNQPQQVSKDAYRMDSTQLSGLSQQLMSDPTLQADGAALQKALDTNNTISKNAVIFNLLQKPKGREMLRGMVK